MSESPRIQIRTGARLHFGLLTVNSKISRQFGGAGMMIDHPGCCLELEVSDRDAVVGPSGERGWESLRNFRRQCPVDQQPPPCRITIQQTIPDHCGFGSGTQIALAVAHGLSLIGSEEQPQTGCLPIDRLADWSGRGRRSAIGIHGFQRGGFLVDGGKSSDARLAPLVARLEIPDDWRILLVRPHDAAGLSGAEEQRAFAALEPLPNNTTAELCRLLLMQILPALAESNFADFGAALADYGRTVGHYFSQSARRWIADPAMQQLVEWVQQDGVSAGQSSWGPTVWILCEHVAAARALQARIESDGRWNDCRLSIAGPWNHGAVVQRSPFAPDPSETLPR